LDLAAFGPTKLWFFEYISVSVGFAGTYMQRVRLRRTALRATPRMNTCAQPPEGAGGSRSKAEGELTLGLMSGEEQWVYTGSLWERACPPTGILIVPTLCVGMPPGTLRVPLSTQGLSPARCDAQRLGMHSNAGVGTIRVVA
jgi:hypothetical protein